MKHFAPTLKAVEETNKKAIKQELLKDLSPVAQKLFWNLFNPYRVFHVRKWDAIEKHATTDVDNGETLLAVLDKLHNKELRGNAAKSAVSQTLALYTEETAQFLARVLGKDAKAGFSGDTYNKIYPNAIPTFDVMLAEKVDDSYEWEFPCRAERKHDGLRSITVVNAGEVIHYSRSGLVHTHLEGLFDEDLIALEEIIGQPFILDCEVLGTDFTSALNAKSKSKGAKAKLEQRLYVFDMMPLSAWETKKWDRIQSDRTQDVLDALERLSEVKADHKLMKTEGVDCNNYAEVKAFFEKIRGELIGGKPGEGIIVKKLNAAYEWDRSGSWAKWKGIITLDLKIVGFYPGRKGTRLEHTLGGVFLEGHDENGTFIKAKCGSGFDDAMRDLIWKNQEDYLGVTCEIEAGEISVSKGEYSARWPIFVRFRDDK